jgi:hypothetical protein
MLKTFKLAMLVLDLVLAAMSAAGCRSDTDSRLMDGASASERIGETVPGQDNRSMSRTWH